MEKRFQITAGEVLEKAPVITSRYFKVVPISKPIRERIEKLRVYLPNFHVGAAATFALLVGLEILEDQYIPKTTHLSPDIEVQTDLSDEIYAYAKKYDLTFGQALVVFAHRGYHQSVDKGWLESPPEDDEYVKERKSF